LSYGNNLYWLESYLSALALSSNRKSEGERLNA